MILDEQIVDLSDIAIGIFWTRIGQMLPDGTPATVHELERLVEAGKPALLYFSNTPVVPGSIDAEQWAAVLDFKVRAKSWGAYGEYAGTTELIERARRDLLSTVRDRLHLPQVTGPAGRELGARPIARVEKRQNQRVDSKWVLKIDNRTSLIIREPGYGRRQELEDELDLGRRGRASTPDRSRS